MLKTRKVQMEGLVILANGPTGQNCHIYLTLINPPKTFTKTSAEIPPWSLGI